jgi:DnaJ domain
LTCLVAVAVPVPWNMRRTSCIICTLICRLKENAELSEIITSYRKLAREWHPDRTKHPRAKAEKVFSDVAHAYEILRNPESRKDYDYALRHPEEFTYNHAKYFYRQFYTRHVRFNPVLVVLFTLACWSAFEWASRSMTFNEAVKQAKELPEYKQNLKRLKEERLQELEREGLIKRKMNGKRCVHLWGGTPAPRDEALDRVSVSSLTCGNSGQSCRFRADAAGESAPRQ